MVGFVFHIRGAWILEELWIGDAGLAGDPTVEPWSMASRIGSHEEGH